VGRTHVDIGAAFNGTEVVRGDLLQVELLLQPNVNTTAFPAHEEVCVVVGNTGGTLALIPVSLLLNGTAAPPSLSWEVVRNDSLTSLVCVQGVPTLDDTTLEMRLRATPEVNFLDSMVGLFSYDLVVDVQGYYRVGSAPAVHDALPPPQLELNVLKPYVSAVFEQSTVTTELYEPLRLLLEVENYDLGRSFNITTELQLSDGLHLVNVTRAYLASPSDPTPTVLGESTTANPFMLDTLGGDERAFLYVDLIAYECFDQSLTAVVDDLAFLHLGLNVTSTAVVDTSYGFPRMRLTPQPVYVVTPLPTVRQFHLRNIGSGRAHHVSVRTSFTDKMLVENVSDPWIYDPNTASFELAPVACANCTNIPWELRPESVMHYQDEVTVSFTLRIGDDFDRCAPLPTDTSTPWFTYYESDCGSAVRSMGEEDIILSFAVPRLQVSSTFPMVGTPGKGFRIPVGALPDCMRSLSLSLSLSLVHVYSLP
jgi:hypothetical protein